MKLAQVKEPSKYTGLYVVDFGDHSGIGFSAEEVAELLDSEQFADVKVYHIYRANPDGTMELKGVSRETFQKESGMFFYALDEQTAQSDYRNLIAWAAREFAPTRCKVHLAQMDNQFITALIYPAEYENAMGKWLLEGHYRTAGLVAAGPSSVRQYYQQDKTILEKTQLWPQESAERLCGQRLLEAAKRTVVR